MFRAFFFITMGLCVLGCSEGEIEKDDGIITSHRSVSSEEISLFKLLGVSSNAVVIYQHLRDEREPRYQEWIISVPELKDKPTASEKYGPDATLLAQVFGSRGIVFNPKDVLETWTVLWTEGGYEYRSRGVVFENKTLIDIQRF